MMNLRRRGAMRVVELAFGGIAMGVGMRVLLLHEGMVVVVSALVLSSMMMILKDRLPQG